MSVCLEELVGMIKYHVLQGTTQTEIRQIRYDSRETAHGDVFVCICEYRTDGHKYIGEAVLRGAVAVVVQAGAVTVEEVMTQVAAGITVLVVNDTRIALAQMAAVYYRYPEKCMKLIGVTGTKGKTTTAYMIRDGLRLAGHKTGLIGTIEVDIGDGERVEKDLHTTPESLDLQRYLREMADAGCDTVVMEVSSQALKLHRTEGIHYAAAVFTNLGEDHIGPGEHADMKEYLECKRRLFLQTDMAVGNQDDAHLEEVWAETACRKIRYAIDSVAGHTNADYRAEHVEYKSTSEALGICCDVYGKVTGKLTLNMPGEYNISNGLAAIAVLKEMGVPDAAVFESLRRIQIPGRMEQVPAPDGSRILIDYAHNAMSLQHSLETLRRYEPQRLIVIFGCGGNRSKSRRMAMGQVAGENADMVIVTTDNPRYEEPYAIMKEIEMGLLKTDVYYTMIADRKEAIHYAVSHARNGDMILIAGKGHENYQEIRGIRYPMDDKGLVKACMQTLS